MEDRKRPAAGSNDDYAPPSKRVAVNGAKVKEEPVEMKEECWIEAYSKGAIYRQMQEYSRKAATAESRLEELHARCVHHDDHLRIIDAWWRQLLEELELIADLGPVTPATTKDPRYLSGVTFKSLHEFQIHIQEKGKAIKSKAEYLLNYIASHRNDLRPDAATLEGKVTNLLASQKEYLLRIDVLSAEKESLSEQLNAATLRYFKAEKKLDRAKSLQVQKLEQQAFANATKSATPAGESGAETGETNGSADDISTKLKEATATVARQKEQVDAALSELKTLQDENSALKIRRDTWTDEDLVRSDVFKQFKGQNEDLIRRVNNLEATNRQLREKAEKLQAERSVFQSRLEAELHQVTQDLEAEIVSRDQDLARVRSARDELLAENTQRKASLEQDRTSKDHLQELLHADQNRIAFLESKITRLEGSGDEKSVSKIDDVKELSNEKLQKKFAKLREDYQAINKELPSIEKAYKKMRDIAQKKVMDFDELEEKVAILIAEKSKADQKYFAARKDADTRNNEIRALRHQINKSTEVFANFKDVHAQTQALVANAERQLADLNQSNVKLAAENKRLETASSECARREESLSRQVSSLTDAVKSRDAAFADARERTLTQEVEAEKLKVKVEHFQKDRDQWKSKALSNLSEEEGMLRTFALCTICRNNFKNTALKTCGHMFCNKCVDDRISNRMRKCPTCSRAFDKMDVMPVHH